MPALEDRVTSLERRLAQLERAGTRPRPRERQEQLPHDVPAAAFEGRPVPSRPRDPAASFGDVLGTRTLAWVGGAVVLLGLAFLFAMAIDRGWISEQMRVIGGVLFSGGLLAFAFVLRDRFGNMEAALAAGATAIAGFFAADLAAGSLYGLISDPLAIAFAAAVAVVGVAIGISWDRESVACLSLGGAVLAPLVFLEQITAGSLMVVVTILAATAALFLWKRWRFAIGIVSAVAMSLAGFWIGMHLSQPALALTVAFVFSAIVTVTAVAFQLIWRKQPLVITTATLLLSAAFLATGAMAAVVSGELFGLSADGVALAALAAAYLIGAVALRAEVASKRDLRTLLWSIGLTLFAAGLLTIADGSRLVLALAALGALLTWVAIELDEPRLQVAAVVYAGIAVLFLLAAVAPPTHLFDETIQPYRHVQGIEAPAFGPELLGILAVAGSLTAMAGLARDRLGAWPAWIAGGLTVYAASLIVVWLFGATVDTGESGQSVFQGAQTTVSVLWGAIGFALLVAGLRSRWAALRTAGFLLLGVALSKLVLYDLTMLTAMARVVSFLAVGLVMLFAAAVHQRLAGEPIERKRKLSQS